MVKGKLIVIDGGDGSGKATQARLLVDYLVKQKQRVKYMDFPQYYHSFYGDLVARFLRGEFGDINQVSPYLASLTYALDRASVKKEMDEFLLRGGFIVSNRYATSNMAHQGVKFKDPVKQKEFLEWVYKLEYKVNKIPKEDIVIYLNVPWSVGKLLMRKKGERKYLSGMTWDIHEKDNVHQLDSQKMYQKLAESYKHWAIVNCLANSHLLPPITIHAKIINILKEKRLI